MYIYVYLKKYRIVLYKICKREGFDPGVKLLLNNFWIDCYLLFSFIVVVCRLFSTMM